ncbi:MAG: cytochrome c [Saprospiraceae bacterium]|nr:cytochrome c [Saprospiraceae bacterium]MCF8249597.1 cytochrome c [Saprospiraceae bacterium]MCF8280497.1 cytochrome c [Bacteroidales bacterium]MCF8310429.1 cytochrome c [Saprospiraceae bacterium]MCF8439807.1 cytochrome c [Saprospiraceae bacterium]
MKKVLKIVGWALAVVAILLAIAAAAIHFGGIPSYEVKAPDLQVQGDSAMVAEGKRHASMVCNQCHMAENGKLEGQYMKDLPEMFGKVWTANITKDPEYGAGRYSDGEIAFLLRTGIKRDGRYAPPWMPKFPHLSDHDLHSVIAYLRSNEPETEASQKVHPASQPSFFTKFLCRVAFKPLPFPSAPIVAPPITDKVAYGKYLSTAKVDCYGCHSTSFETMNMMEPDKTPGYFSGGNPMPDLDGNIVFTRNLTPDKETGIGNWTEEQFVKAVKFGQRPNGQIIRYPMVPHGALSDEEVSTIWAYLQTIPAIKNDVDKLYATASK